MARYPFKPEAQRDRMGNAILNDAYHRQWGGADQQRPRRTAKLIPINGAVPMRLKLRAPVHERQSPQIADSMKQADLLVLNLEQCDQEAGRRLLDFMSGAAYADGYNITQISSLAYLITPPYVQVCASMAAMLQGRYYSSNKGDAIR